MVTADDILRRMADDAAFAADVETDPTGVLTELGLTDADIGRVVRVVAEIHRAQRPAPPSD